MVAKQACALSTAEQIQQANTFHEFVSDLNFSTNAAQLNTVEDILPILVGVPGQSKVHVIYGIVPPNLGLMTDEANFLLEGS